MIFWHVTFISSLYISWYMITTLWTNPCMPKLICVLSSILCPVLSIVVIFTNTWISITRLLTTMKIEFFLLFLKHQAYDLSLALFVCFLICFDATLNSIKLFNLGIPNLQEACLNLFFGKLFNSAHHLISIFKTLNF